MPKLPPINEIIRTISGRNVQRELDAEHHLVRPGITRRKFLQGMADRAMPEMGQGAEDLETTLGQAHFATKFFKSHPKDWNSEWGPLEEAEPEDIIDAFLQVGGNDKA